MASNRAVRGTTSCPPHQARNTQAMHPIRGDEMRALRKLRRQHPKDAYVFVSERRADERNGGSHHHLIQRLGKAAGMATTPRAAALSRSQKYPTSGSLYRAVSRAVPRLLEGLSITAATAALRLGGILMVGTLLAACSSSNRVEGVVPSWANPSPRSITPRSEAHKKGLERPDTDARGAKQPDGQPLEE